MLFTAGLWVDHLRIAAVGLGIVCIGLAVSAMIDPRGVAYRRPVMLVLALLVGETVVVSVEQLGRPAGAGLLVRLVALSVGAVTLWQILRGAPGEGHRG